MVKTLLAAGADVNRRDLGIRAATISNVSNSGNVEALKILIAHGADVN